MSGWMANGWMSEWMDDGWMYERIKDVGWMDGMWMGSVMMARRMSGWIDG